MNFKRRLIPFAALASIPRNPAHCLAPQI